jgi:hypothetical protein
MRAASALLMAALLVLLACRTAAAAQDPPVEIVIGAATVALDGPWRFHLGDDPRWAAPDFDDSSWEQVDLTPLPGAHDDDVGLSRYVSGWTARGHADALGYAWYRLHATVRAPTGFALALAGPAAVDSAYEVYCDGRLLGGIGDFSGAPPRATSVQPRLFPLPGTSGPVDIAFRVWMGPWEVGAPGAGGIRIAPLLGEESAARLRYREQWLETLKGYVVDAVEPLGFLLLAVIALAMHRLEPAGSPYRWLAMALVVSAVVRANQAFFFWLQCETVQGFEMTTVVLLTPAALAAWTLAWLAWFRLHVPRWAFWTALGAAGVYALAQFLGRSWFHGAFPHALGRVLHVVIMVARIVLLVLLGSIAYRGVRQERSEGWLALPALLLVATGLFAQELSAIHVKGIWFPYGTGVSRTQYAYAAFQVALFALLLRRVRQSRG